MHSSRSPRAMAWRWLVTSAIWALSLLSPPSAVHAYSIAAPLNYVAFSGDVNVVYLLPLNVTSFRGSVRLIELPRRQVLASVEIPPGFQDGELSFMCGLVDHVGRFVFQLIDEDVASRVGTGLLAESEVMVVRWPQVTLSLPATHEALTSDVDLRFSLSDVRCESVVATARYSLLILFGQTTVFNDTVIKLQQLHTKTLSCSLFDRAGTYVATLASHYDIAGARLGWSNSMETSWGEYAVRATASAIMPCLPTKVFVVRHEQPRCTGTGDKVRLYKVILQAESSVASPQNLVYVAEQRVRPSVGAVTFDCQLFNDTVIGYCFKYVSIATSGAVTEQANLCLPTDPKLVIIDGGWSEWSPWSRCSESVRCGTGAQSRIRVCDNPKPTFGGKFCDGNALEWRDCDLPCNRDNVSSSTTTLPFNADPACACGCNLYALQGHISSSALCASSAVWNIRVAEGYVIELNFLTFTLASSNLHTWIKVRDGDSEKSSLLLYTDGGVKPSTVHSTHNAMRIEFMSPYRSSFSFDYGTSQEGFTAIYISHLANRTRGDVYVSRVPAWQGLVSIVAIIVSAALVACIVFVACHHRISSRHKKNSQRTQVRQALLSPDVANASPTHGGVVIDDDMMCEVKVATSKTAEGSARMSTRGASAEPLLLMSPDRGNVIMYTTGDPSRCKHTRGHHHRPHRSSTRYSLRGLAAADEERRMMEFINPAAVDQCSPIHRPATTATLPSTHAYDRRVNGSEQRMGDSGVTMSPCNCPNCQLSNGGCQLCASYPSASLSRRQPRYPEDLYTNRRDYECTLPANHSLMLANAAQSSVSNQATPTLNGTSNGQTAKSNDKQTRPPLVGQDSLGSKTSGSGSANVEINNSSADTASPRKRSNQQQQQQTSSTSFTRFDGNKKPPLQPLLLRDITRPDGRSPDNIIATEGGPKGVTTPTLSQVSLSSGAGPPGDASGLSPYLRKTALFPAADATTPCESILMNDFEYDDYDVTETRASYFAANPPLYTLTWSTQPDWLKSDKGLDATETSPHHGVSSSKC